MTPTAALPILLAATLIAASSPPTTDAAQSALATRPKCTNPVPQMTGADKPRPLFHRLHKEPDGVIIAAVERRVGRCLQPVVLSEPLPPNRPNPPAQ